MANKSLYMLSPEAIFPNTFNPWLEVDIFHRYKEGLSVGKSSQSQVQYLQAIIQL